MNSVQRIAQRILAGTDEDAVYQDMLQDLAQHGVGDLNGMCLELSALFQYRLSQADIPARLRRRYSDEHGGHWTVETDDGEFDPTIAFWGKHAPEGSEPGSLYRVHDESPHHGWEDDAAVDEGVAHELAREEFDVDDLDELVSIHAPRRGDSSKG